ncbi:MAG: Asp-tRNA(Asn)/Glu-tRNA(Gln) amidotransferase subunit GatA [Pirellulaceae bacterium]
MALLNASATSLLAELQAGKLTAVELTSASLNEIRRQDQRLHAFLDVASDAAMQQAEQVDARRRAGQPVGKLAGLPIAVKDVLCTQGWTTTCASRMLEHFRPPYNATVIDRLHAADAVLIGKANLDEFAMGGSTENSAFGPTKNPWDVERTPGGSSGGSAACVAARMVPLSLGTDTGGSIRQPSAFCGITGLKPTYGRVSRFGLVAFASSLDQIGPLGRTVEDVALLLEVIAGHDTRDATCVAQPVPAYAQSLRQPFAGLRLGIVREHLAGGLDADVEAAVREAIRVLQGLGAEVREVSLPHSRYAVATYYIIAPCEASSNLARYDGVHYGYRTDERQMLADLAQELPQAGTAGARAGDIDSPLVRLYRQSRAEGFGSEVKRRIMLGTYALSSGYYDAYYLKALRVRRLIRQDYDEAFRTVDLLIGPTTPRPAFRLGELNDDPLKMYLEDLFTVSSNLAGIAGISVPCGLTRQGLPIGLQLQAPPFAEVSLLQAAHLYQSHTDWHLRRPGN